LITVVRKTFGPKSEEFSGGGRMHSEELHGLYSSADLRMMKSRRLRWAGHVARMGEKRNACGVLVMKLE
jgi:hypothetical protein